MECADAVGSPTVYVRSCAPRVETHAHDFHQLILPICGSMELEVGGHYGRVAELTGALVPAGERHAFAARGTNQLLVVDLPDKAVVEAGASEWVHRSSEGRFFPVTRAAARLAAWFADELRVEGASAHVGNAFATLLVATASRAGTPSLAPAAVRRALTFIDTNGLRPLSVGDVARAAGVGVGHLHALFRLHVGRTPGMLIRTRRLDEARRLLTVTDLPIAEVALRCGFADQASLTHAMRREVGTTPGRLRRHRF